MATPDQLLTGVLAAVFVSVALWEQARPQWLAGANAGRRWLTNVSLFVLCTAAAALMFPLRSAAENVTAQLAALPSFGDTAIGSAAHFAMIVLVLDFAYYWGHRLMHARPMLWRIHAIHHTDLDLDLTTNLRHHPAEVLLFSSVVIGVGIFTGASPAEMLAYSIMAFSVQTLAHANVAMPAWLESTLGLVLVTPRNHWLHHSRDESDHHTNFGEVFVFWDHLFRTWSAPSRPAPASFGVREYLAPGHHTLYATLIEPFSAQTDLVARQPCDGESIDRS